jgi:Flp pilus assembly protein TadG
VPIGAQRVGSDTASDILLLLRGNSLKVAYERADTVRMSIRSRPSERGAALVEMAVVLPFFALLIFGVMEASWVFAQVNDAHHGVREGARLAAVDYSDNDPATTDDVLAEMCDRMGLASGTGTYATLAVVQPNGDGFNARGATGNSSVTVDYESLTGFLDFAFGGLTLSSDVNFLLEAPLDKSDATRTGTLECDP